MLPKKTRNNIKIANSSKILNDRLHDVSTQQNVPVQNRGIFDGVAVGCDIQMMAQHVANLALVTLESWPNISNDMTLSSCFILIFLQQHICIFGRWALIEIAFVIFHTRNFNCICVCICIFICVVFLFLFVFVF